VADLDYGGRGSGIPVVQCPETYAIGHVPGSDPSRFGRRTVVVMNEPDPETGVQAPSFSFQVDGPNDPDVIAATAKYSKSGLGPKEMATAVYREVAALKAARDRSAPATPTPAPAMNEFPAYAPRPADPARRPVPVINGAPPPAAVVPAHPPFTPPPVTAAPAPVVDLFVYPPPAPPAPPPPPARDPIRVEYLLADGGTIEMYYEDVEISGDTLALVAPVGAGGLYTPPKSDPGTMRPVYLTVAGLPDPLVAYRLQDTYTVGGRRHTVLMLERS